MLIARFWRGGRLASETTILKLLYLRHLPDACPEALINKASPGACSEIFYLPTFPEGRPKAFYL